MAITALGVTRPGAPLPRGLNYESKLLFHLRAADLLLAHDPTEAIANALTGEGATFGRATAGGYTRDAFGYLRQWGQAIPRLKMYDLDGDGYYEEPGILLESARTNGFTFSRNLGDAAWIKTRATVSANATVGPDRQSDADKLVEDGTASNTHRFDRNTPALTDDTQQSFSVFAKAAGRSEILMEMTQKGGAVANAWFDLSAGTVGTVSGGAVGLIEKYADGWYRCMLMTDSSNGVTTPVVRVFLGSGSETNSYNGDGASGVYFWGLQFEVDAAFPSSFNVTDGSTTARNADALTYALSWLGQTITEDLDDVTVYARMARPFHADAVGALGVSPTIMSLSSTTAILRINYLASVRQMRSSVDTAATDADASESTPTGATLEAVGQFGALRTGGQTRIDTGTGFSAFVTGATAFSGFGDTTLTIGNDLFGALFELKVARGLRTLKQMQEAF